jgi:poly(3-hydroxybutyrate) depolymerase/glycerophosphoryl diester phosphodiesterase
MRRLAACAYLLVLVAACSDGATVEPPYDLSETTPPVAVTTPATAAPTTQAATTTTEPAPQYAATIDELLAYERPIVLAHTAGEDQYPASTLYGFGESVKAGVDMLDLNVLLTKDGVLMVQHDDTVDRSTNGTGAVADLTYAEIAALDDAYWFTTDCGACTDQPEASYLYRGIRTGERPPPSGYSADDFAMPTFQQLVKRFPDIPLNIEIKGNGDAAKAAANTLLVELNELGRADAAVVASFDDEIVSYFHSIAPDIEVSPGLGVLTEYVLNGTPVPDGMRILQLPPEYSGLQVITPELVAQTEIDGYPIWVWPNDRNLENYDQYLAFLQLGVRGLNINFPAQGVQAVHDFITPDALVAALPTAACSHAALALEPDSTLSFGAASLAGSYLRHLPPSYDGEHPLPVVFDLHGWSQSAAIQVLMSDLPSYGDAHRFITITPDITRPVELWDVALDSPDTQWMRALLNEVEETLCIDQNRVFFTGMSYGATMTSSVVCALSDRVAAAAPVAGINNPEGCTFERPVPVVAFHGTDDQYLAYGGGFGPAVAGLPNPAGDGTLGDGSVPAATDYQSVPEMTAEWAARNGCDAAEPTESEVSDEVTLLTWACPSDAQALLYRVNGGGHAWPGSDFSASIVDYVGHTTMTISANDIIWAFFRSHPLGS